MEILYVSSITEGAFFGEGTVLLRNRNRGRSFLIKQSAQSLP